MSNIGGKIKDYRTKKGLSQEELAESAKVNLRTIQRIENNENEPRMNTLKLICQVLEINDNELLEQNTEIDKDYIFYLHLSILSGLLIPLGNIILPLILWLNKKNEINGLSKTGANLLNFQFIWSTITFLLIITLAQVGFPPYIILYMIFISFMINITLAIIGAINTKKGKSGFQYPKLIKIIK